MNTETHFLPLERERHWSASGLNRRQERAFKWLATSLIVVMVSGWAFSIADLISHRDDARASAVTTSAPVAATRTVTSALLDPRTKSTAFINEAAMTFLTPLRGSSGKLRAAFRTPGEGLSSRRPTDPVSVRYSTGAGDEIASSGLAAPVEPGIYEMAVELNRARQAVKDLKIITLVPFEEKRGGKIGLYYLGSWPFENGGQPKSPAYANPHGFIRVTQQNQDTYVSQHFKLRDFLTKDQGNVWPKYLLLQTPLLDKLELVIAELEAQGHTIKHVQVMSGFRTPRYNHGGGNTGGRANLSRHMYGDGADIFVDNDRNGMLDDLNRDGRVDVSDAEVMSRAAEAVERKFPALVGGVGTYVACCGHGPFTHVDVRGHRARWRGTGNG